MRRRVLEALSERGILIEPDAVDFLSKQPNAMQIVEDMLYKLEGGPPMIIGLGYLEGLMKDVPVAPITDLNLITKARIRPESEGKVLLKKDITGNSTSVGDITNFARLFQDRFRTIRRMLLRRRELQGNISISKAKTAAERDVRIIGMVKDVRTTKNGHRMIEMEDEDDTVLVLVVKGSKAFSDLVVNDEIIGIVGKPAKNSRKGDMIVADEIIRPDVPIGGGMKKTDVDAWAVFAGDVHVGSNTFLSEQWNHFIEWLKTSEEAKKVKYLIMPGDLVDGIGIYPDHEEELLVTDVYKQYEMLAEQLKQIRSDITIIASPGNHDAVRLAEPQPALPDAIKKMFGPNVMMVGNPAYFEIEGRNVLIYHGRSIDDWISAVPGLSYSRPLEVMKEMLRRRHLAPIYGERTAIAPEEKDYMVIDEVPDIFVTGHVHHAGMGDYRGVVMINASTWQSQTAFQKMHNHTPDPCKAFMIHLGTGKARVMNFN
jgi:DNA polymerase II small subunit